MAIRINRLKSNVKVSYRRKKASELAHKPSAPALIYAAPPMEPEMADAHLVHQSEQSHEGTSHEDRHTDVDPYKVADLVYELMKREARSPRQY